MTGVALAGRRQPAARPDTDQLPEALLLVAGETTIPGITLRNLAAAGIREIGGALAR